MTTNKVSVQCPECGQYSDSIKRYTLPNYVLFLFIYARWQEVEYTCCPNCMRKHILTKGFTYNILMANMIWPFTILPWMLIQLIRSFTKGHSKTVQKIIEKRCK